MYGLKQQQYTIQPGWPHECDNIVFKSQQYSIISSWADFIICGTKKVTHNSA